MVKKKADEVADKIKDRKRQQGNQVEKSVNHIIHDIEFLKRLAIVRVVKVTT
ncbi:MAG TPA: hypothetical protein PKJ94_02960 [Ferruginibacter sp.]|nr:hypothetical protein [Ferruginibacter sp.]